MVRGGRGRDKTQEIDEGERAEKQSNEIKK